MRLISNFDWEVFFESVSLVDQVLRERSNFGAMDFATRDAYRHAIEDLSRGSDHSEIEIAELAVNRGEDATSVTWSESTRQSDSMSQDERLSDPGYYLISRGRLAFEHEIGFRVPLKRRLLRFYVHAAAPGYLGTIALLTLAIMILPLAHSWESGVNIPLIFLLGFLATIPASDLAIALINRGVTDLLGPRLLPRLEMRAIPEKLRTIVVVPILLTSINEISEQVQLLEIHYLANSDGDMRFALLSDWVDADTETLPNDENLLAAASNGIAELNKRHGSAPGGGNRFFLFHRRRLWNDSEGKWMGWERKRGKLHELNLLLRNSVNTTFITSSGHSPEAISGVRYVITLDADTRLPRGAAARLVGTMAHPLNRAIFSEEKGRVVEGYGIIQPRITPSLPADRDGSFFQKIFSAPAGIDPYSSAVSDVYQDLFREGSYTGKGIYDLDVFEAALAGKVPENILLSHDLFEGLFARTALATDIELFDEFPTHYDVAASRQHRWARGDWQLLPWIVTGTAGSRGGREFAIPLIGRWKMLDNLRRSLLAPSMFLILVIGWLTPEISPWLWVRFILPTIAIPSLIPFFAGLTARIEGISKRSHFHGVVSDLWLGLWQAGLTITFLAYQAWLMADAIGRTLARLLVTRKHMLEWVTAAQAKYRVRLNLYSAVRRNAGGVILAFIALAAVWLEHPYALVAAFPLVILWIAEPGVALWISLPSRPAEKQPLSWAQTRTLRIASRRTWRFFETFVTSGDHSLPPDNLQEDPKFVVAHRTSPTNIGLCLLSTLAARDFGWVGTQDALERFEATFETLGKLDQFHGHLYNWYDTRDLRPLDPKYVSTVDSGNLAGHILALASGCRELIQRPFLEQGMFAGIEDAIDLLREALAKIAVTARIHSVTRKQLGDAVDLLAASVRSIPASVLDKGLRIVEIVERAHTVADIVQTLARELGDAASSEMQAWAKAVKASADSHLRDAKVLLPWLALNPREAAMLGGNRSPQGVEWAAIEPFFVNEITLASAPDKFEGAIRELTALRDRLISDSTSPSAPFARIDALIESMQRSSAEATSLYRRLLAIARRSEEMFEAMDFSFLFDSDRKLFSIGYRAAEGQLDDNCYDLLASEARLASFIAIAKGDVPLSHWFRLGRPLTPVGRGSALISWSGSMFEYLMPALVMGSPPNSLLSHTYQQVVTRQIEYGKERGVPWGISESAYDARDIDLTYQYCSFGVPGLGLKRGLSGDLVIAPYATGLAAMVDPSAAIQNLDRLTQEGAMGTNGFYEALDYTSSRLPEGQNVSIVRAYMAHHQGMFLLALANTLHDGAMRKRFHDAPIVKATELLMQERTPRNVLVARPRAEEVSTASSVRDLAPPAVRKFTTPHHAIPRTGLLSNGRYTVMLTSAGSGYSRWRDIAITRWREDVTRDCWGAYIYLRDEQTGSVWSPGFQPSGNEPDSYEAAFFEDHAEIIRRDRSLTTALEVVVSYEDDVEVRRVSITNTGLRPRDIQVTSYAEIALTSQANDAAHPAFSNLFVETEFVPEFGTLLATRRKRSDGETPVWAAHLVFVEGESVGDLQYETDRSRFIGRTRNLRNAISIVDGRPLSNTVGSVLDPVMSLRRIVHIEPGHSAHLIFSTIVASTRVDVLNLVDKYRDTRTFERTRTLAWTQAQVQLRHLDISAEEANLFQRLANPVVYSDATLRPSSEVLSSIALDRSALWGQGISGDLPIVVARIDDVDDVDMIRQLLRAHEYWRMKRLAVDVVIINEKSASYVQDLQGSLESLVRGSQLRLSPETSEAGGKIFLLRGDLLPPQTRAQLQAAARIVLLSRRGTLSDQIERSESHEAVIPPPIRPSRAPGRPAPETPETLQYFNGLGGFADEGREYAVVLTEGLRTPEPWINVIANEKFGFLVSESGSGFTWSLNSHENQITSWSNDHVIDPPR
jgi:cyclic beta-1,2-glucan synthetase